MDSVCEQINSCAACSLCVNGAQKFIGQGDIQAEVMILDLFPIGRDILRQRLYQDKAGKWFLQLLADAGFRRGDLYMTTLVKCPVPKGEMPGKVSLKSCREHLLKQIEVINPEVVITLGESTLKALLPETKKKISVLRGDAISALGRTIIPTYHPTWVLSQAKKLREDELYKDLWRSYELVFPQTKRRKRIKKIPV